MANEIMHMIDVEDYAEFQKIMELPPSHAEWLVRRERFKSDLKSRGATIQDVTVTPEEFSQYWRTHGNGKSATGTSSGWKSRASATAQSSSSSPSSTDCTISSVTGMAPL